MGDLTTYTEAVGAMVPGAHPLDADSLAGLRLRSVRKAINAHSKHRPTDTLDDVAGTGTDIPVSALGAWVVGFSAVARIEIVGGEYVDAKEWRLYRTPDGWVIRFDWDTDVSKSYRITYSIRHFIDAEACSVEDADEDAVQALAASYYCKMLAAAYALETDPTIGADRVSGQGSMYSRFLRLADTHYKEYAGHVGISKDGKPGAASGEKDLDVVKTRWGGRLLHPGT